MSHITRIGIGTGSDGSLGWIIDSKSIGLGSDGFEWIGYVLSEADWFQFGHGTNNASTSHILSNYYTRKEEVEQEENNYKWLQTKKEVEIKFLLKLFVQTEDVEVTIRKIFFQVKQQNYPYHFVMIPKHSIYLKRKCFR